MVSDESLERWFRVVALHELYNAFDSPFFPSPSVRSIQRPLSVHVAKTWLVSGNSIAVRLCSPVCRAATSTVGAHWNFMNSSRCPWL